MMNTQSPQILDSATCSPETYRNVLKRLGCIVSYTRGVSMLPLIKERRNYVGVVALDGEPQINDILLFEQERGGERKNILHRLIEVREDGGEKTYVTRGDNCLYCEYLKRDNIIGRVDSIFKTGTEQVIKMDDPEYLEYVRKLELSWPRRRRWYRLRQSYPARVVNLLLHPSRIIPAIRRRLHK